MKEKFAHLARPENLRKVTVDMVFICVGCALMAFGNIGILVPAGLSAGGITGIVRMLQQVVSLDFSIMYYAGAMIILLICAVTMGLKEAKKILLMSVVFPLFLMIFEQLDFVLLEEDDMILAAIFYGVISGVGCGLVFWRGYSSGGSDTVAKIIRTKLLPHMALSKILLFIDATIIICSGFVFGRNVALYALISSALFTKATETTLYGFDSKLVQLEIISERHAEIAHYILNDIGRGMTNVPIMGEYTKTQKNKMVSICSPRESMLIRHYVAKVDPGAFVTVFRVETVWGEGKGFVGLDEEL